jgi:hypothetical protein
MDPNADSQYKQILAQIKANPRIAKEFILQQTKTMLPDADTNPEIQQMQLLRDDEVMPFLKNMLDSMPIADAMHRMKQEMHMPDMQVQMIGTYLEKFKRDIDAMETL